MKHDTHNICEWCKRSYPIEEASRQSGGETVCFECAAEVVESRSYDDERDYEYSED